MMDKGLIIMRPTEDCNLACRYCYSVKSSKVLIMNKEVLEVAIRKILGFYKQATFVWHGGESTLAEIGFFKEAIRFQDTYKKEGQKIINEIQTNGTLVDEKWAKFFKECSFFVGVSIDGPQEINDSVRIHQNSKGAYEDILRGINVLKNYGVNVAGICVLAKHNIDCVDEIIDFYEKHDMPLNINPFISSGKGSMFSAQLLISPEEYSGAMIRIFDRWFENPSIKIYDFYKIIKSFFTGSNNICCYSGKCSSEYISVCPNGDVYPCGRWAGEKTFLMGNIERDLLEDIISSGPAIKILNRGKLLDECQNCQWFEVCNGGCPHTAFLYNKGDIHHQDFYCQGRKNLFTHIYNKVSKELEKSRKATLLASLKT